MRPGTREPWTGSYALNGWFYSGDWPNGAGLFPLVKNAFRMDAVCGTRARARFSDSNVVDAWPQERDRPASNLATGNAGENAGMARITLARHKYSAGGTSVLSRNFKNSALPGAINLVFYDGHAELAANEELAVTLAQGVEDTRTAPEMRHHLFRKASTTTGRVRKIRMQIG